MFAGGYWQREGQVLVVEFNGIATFTDLNNSITVAQGFLDSTPSQKMIHIIVDVAAVKKVDTSLFKLYPIRKAMKPIMEFPALGWIVFIDPTPTQVMRFIFTTIAEVTTRRLRFVTSREQAFQFIQDADPTIPRD